MTKPNIKVGYDEDGQQWLCEELFEDDFGTFVAWHQRRNLGKVNAPSHSSFLQNLPRDALRIPIFIYEHGGFVLSTTPFSCPWDSGQVGVWVFTPKDLARIYGEDTEESRKKAREGVEAQIKYMNDVFCGNVWYFEIEDFDGETADSCGMFVGIEEALEAMKEHVPENLHGSLEKAWDKRW